MHYSMTLSTVHSSFDNQQPQNYSVWKPAACSPHKEAECWELPKNLIPREFSLFDLSVSLMKSSILRACLYSIWLRVLFVCTQGIYIYKKNNDNCLTSLLLDAAIPVRPKKQLIRNPTKNMEEWDVHKELCKGLTYFGNLESH